MFPLPLLLILALPVPDDAEDGLDLQRAASRLRSSALEEGERDALERELLDAGEEGIALLLDVLGDRERELRERFDRDLPRYLKGYQSAARKFIASRARRIKKEIEAARDAIHALRRSAALTKDDIATRGDPARRELERILSVDNAELLEARAELAKARAGLLEIADGISAIHERMDEAELRLDPLAYLERDEPPARDDPFARLLEAEETAAAMAVATDRSDRAVMEKNEKLAERIQPEEYRGILALNVLRVRLGLRPLPIDVRLCDACRDHSRDMHELGFFSHTSPVPGKRTPSQRAARFKTSAGAENIAAGQRTGEGAIDAWWHSPGHMKNMLGGHGRVGLGRHEHLWTQLFG